MTFLVISYDYSNTSSIKVHYLGLDDHESKEIYNQLHMNICNLDGSKPLIELLRINNAYSNLQGRTLFWPSESEKTDHNIMTIQTNN